MKSNVKGKETIGREREEERAIRKDHYRQQEGRREEYGIAMQSCRHCCGRRRERIIQGPKRERQRERERRRGKEEEKSLEREGIGRPFALLDAEL